MSYAVNNKNFKLNNQSNIPIKIVDISTMPDLNLSHITVDKLDDSDELIDNKIIPRYEVNYSNAKLNKFIE